MQTRTATEFPKTVASTDQREPIGGGLIVMCLLLVPHVLNSAWILANSLPVITNLPRNIFSVETLRVVTLTATMVGNLAGLTMIVTRNRFTPAFFTIYLPLVLLLFFADPDPGATVRDHAQRIGYEYSADKGLSVPHVILAFGSTAIVFGYWLRSQRVRRTFGSTGLEILRRRGSKSPPDNRAP